MSDLFREATWLGGTSMHGYGTWPIPHELDIKISDLLHTWCNLNETQRVDETLTISDQQRMALLAYSERMASKAIRNKDKTSIHLGLIALGVDGWKVDWRDNTMILSLLNHSAEVIGVDPIDVFIEASKYFAPNVKKSFELFLKRKKEDKSIDAMGFCESQDEGGFRYKRTW